MPLSPEERRFVRYWQEQSQGGRWRYIPVYAFGYFIVLFMSGVALGLFMGLPFVQLTWLAGLALLSLAGAWAIAALQWRRQSQKFRNIIKRETADPST